MEQNKMREQIEKIDNTSLEKAIKDFSAAQSKDNMVQLMANMHPAILFVPARFPADMDKNLLKDLSAGQPNKIPQGVKMIPAVLKNTMGDKFFPVFTSREQIPADQKYPAMLCIPFVECRNLIDQANGEIKAMVVNPFTNNLVLNPAFMEATKKAEQQRPQAKRVQMTVKEFNTMVRTQIERGVLPRQILENGEAMVDKICEEREEFIYGVYAKSYETGSVACPYTVDDFSVMVLDLSDTMRYIHVKLPEKNLEKGAAKAVYIVWNPQEKKAFYYMAQVIEPGKAQLLQVCGPKEVRNLGPAPAEGEEIRSIMELFEQ